MVEVGFCRSRPGGGASRGKPGKVRGSSHAMITAAQRLSSNAVPRSASAAPSAPPRATSSSGSSPKAILLTVLGGAVGALSTALYATIKGWSVVVPTVAWAKGLGTP